MSDDGLSDLYFSVTDDLGLRVEIKCLSGQAAAEINEPDIDILIEGLHRIKDQIAALKFKKLNVV
jgi:hypothetical protein